MGCGGSKKEAKSVVSAGEKHVGSERKEPPKVVEVKEEEEFTVVQPGKSLAKSELDRVTDNSTGALKNVDKSVNETRESPNVLEMKYSEKKVVEEQTVIIEAVEENKEKNREELIYSNTTKKVEFDKHPHEFDFSFIEEPPKVNHDKDAFTDEILKEMTLIE